MIELSLLEAAAAGVLRVDGLNWWEEVKPQLWRLPERYRERVTPIVWKLSQQPCGARICLRTNARSMWVNVGYPAQSELFNISRLGRQGLDYYVDGLFARGLVHYGETEKEHCLFDGSIKPHGQFHDITINLAQYGPQEILGLRFLPDDAAFEAPTPYALAKPLVIYGSSITQGGCCGRPGLNWPATLARMLNVDHVNLAMSGAGLGEPVIWEIMAEVDAACYILDYGINHVKAEDMEAVYAPFLDHLRTARPDVPVICVSPIYSGWEAWGYDYKLNRMREHIAAVCAERAGDPLIYHVAGYDLLGPADREGITDASHANELGFRWMAERLAPTVRRALGV